MKRTGLALGLWLGWVATAAGCAVAEEPLMRRDGGTVRDTGSAVDTGSMMGCSNASLTLCGTLCVDTQSNDTHCGACMRSCSAGQSCVGGMCQGSSGCPSGQLSCGGSCVTVATSSTHCGRCNNPCAAGQTCQAGTCSGASTPARTGQACTSEMDCGTNPTGRGFCRSAGEGWSSGYCQYLCETNADCGAGGRCGLIEPTTVGGMMRNIGTCFTGCPSAGSRTGCRTGYVCLMAPEGGVCVPACDASPSACGANRCDAASGQCLQCTGSADCNGGGACSGGTCSCTASTNCGTNRRCITSTGQCGCSSSASCPAGWTCTTSTGQCAPP